MSETRSKLLPLGLLLTGVLLLSGCQALQDLGVGGGTEPALEEITEDTTEAESAEEAPTADAPIASAGFVLPACDTLYSAGQKTALLDEVRVSVGDTSDGDFGWGTTNRDLVGLLKAVRADLRLSCTWYLPASESVSVTSLAIIESQAQSVVSRLLQEAGATGEGTGGGTLWRIDQAVSGESPDYTATEAHFLAPVTCPASLVETRCVAWFSTNYAFGQAETLTLDAARNLGVYTN